MVEIKENGTSPVNYKIIIPVVTILAVAAAAVASGKFGTFDFAQVVEQSASKIEKMGPYGYLYFALVSLSLVFCIIDESALKDSHVDVNLTSKPQSQVSIVDVSKFNVALFAAMKSDSSPFLLTQIYIVAEVLAVPALPLTASSGYLFGLIPGFITVLVSATIAASISFLIGRTLLRDWAQSVASGLCYTFYSIL